MAGKDFFATVVRPEGLLWVGIGLLITVVPTIVVGVIALHKHKYDFGTVCGIICGSMANPMALGYANDTLKATRPASAMRRFIPWACLSGW